MIGITMGSLFVGLMALSTAVWSLPQTTRIQMPNDSKCVVSAVQVSDLMNCSLNDSRLGADGIEFPKGFRVTFDVVPQPLPSLRDIYIVAIEAMYRLSLQPWESPLTQSWYFRVPGQGVWITIPTYRYSQAEPYSFAVSGLYEGVLFQHDRASKTGRVNVLRVNTLWHKQPMGVVQFREAPTLQPFHTPLPRTSEAGNTTLRVANEDSGTYIDGPFHIVWRNYGPLILYEDVYLAAFNGIAATAIFPATMSFSEIHAVTPSKATRTPTTIVVSSTNNRQHILTYKFAARALQLITVIMEKNGWFGEMTFDLIWAGEQIGKGSVESYYRDTGSTAALE